MYADAWTHFKDEERYALLLLHRYVLKRQGRALMGASPLDALARMDGAALADFFASAGADVLAANMLDGSIGALREALDARLARSRQAGVALPLDGLARAFGLSGAARGLLFLLATGHFSPVVRELLGAITGTRWQPLPRGEGLAELVASDHGEYTAALAALADDAPLLRYRLLEPGPLPDGWDAAEAPPVGSRAYVLSQRVRDWLDGRDDALDPQLRPLGRVLRDAPGLSALELDEAQRDVLATILPAEGGAPLTNPPPLWFIGPRGSEVQPLIGALAAALGRTPLWIEVDLWLQHHPSHFDWPEAPLLREAVLGAHALVLDFSGADEHHLLERDAQTRALRLIQRAEEGARTLGFPLLLHTTRPLKFLRLHCSHIDPVVCAFPSSSRRAGLWRQELQALGLELSDADIDQVAAAFVLTGEDIARVARTALRQLRVELADTLEVEALLEICRDDMDIRLQGLTRRIRRPWGLDDIVLRRPQREAMEEIIAYARFRDEIFEAWGFSRHFVVGRGVHCMFSGPPGTGKTMAASVIANALKLPLYRIELSQVVDRYVGETEKRLQQIFDEASRAPCALLFDEADSLFAKRTEVKSSNDRYANLEVNYLLQRMEEFDGVTFLTTNLPGSLDDAFIRRIPFQIDFPEPDRDLTRQLWGSLIPNDVELSDDVDFEFLAEHFEMTGGHIKNVILRAALRAMREGREHLNQEDFITAALVEYAKLGRLPPQEFR